MLGQLRTLWASSKTTLDSKRCTLSLQGDGIYSAHTTAFWSYHGWYHKNNHPMRRWTNVDVMLAHRLRLWANIQSTFVQRLVFAGRPRWRLPQSIHGSPYTSALDPGGVCDPDRIVTKNFPHFIRLIDWFGCLSWIQGNIIPPVFTNSHLQIRQA